MTIGSTGIGASSIGAAGEASTSYIFPTGISSTTAFGLPNLVPNILPIGIASGLIFGLPQLPLSIVVTGIASGLVFGDHAVSSPIGALIDVQGIASGLVFGSHIVAFEKFIQSQGIVTTAIIGVPHMFDAPFYTDIDPVPTPFYKDIPV